MKFAERLQSDKTALFLFSALCFLLGLVIGFIWSPVKNGVTIGSNNRISGKDDEDECELES